MTDLCVADPACGAGAWLAAARRYWPQARLRGCERDPALLEVWRERGLLDDPRVSMYVADGVLTETLPDGYSDLVVGNLPLRGHSGR